MSKPLPKNILICPYCSSDKLLFRQNKIECKNCKSEYSHSNDKYFFENIEEKSVFDPIDNFKSIFKKYPVLYKLLVYLFSPVYIDNKSFYKFIEENTSKFSISVNFGSGCYDLSENVSNVDIFPYQNVDLTCNIERIPFQSQSVDTIICTAVLEHIDNPEKAISEFYRVLKNNGKIYLNLPFIAGYHASPQDFFRITEEGLKKLMKDFREIEILINGGPVSGFLWIFQEWIAILLSFGNETLYKVILFLTMIFTFPLKFLDIILRHHPKAKNISSGFTFIGEK